MKKILLLLILIFNFTLHSQTYENPFNIRTNKSVAITSVQILPNSIKVNMQYLGSSLYVDGWIRISKSTKLFTNQNEEAKLINVENIDYESKTIVKKGVIKNFSLYFDKVQNLEKKEFFIIEDSQDDNAFNFYNIQLTNHDNPNYHNKPKDDYFLKYIPYPLHFIFHWKLFIESKLDTRSIFEEMIEDSYNDKIPGIKDMKTEETSYHGKKALVYFITYDNIPSALYLEFLYVKDEKGLRINNISASFSDKNIAQKYFNSIVEWYGATHDNNSGIKVDMGDRYIYSDIYSIIFNITSVYNDKVFRVSIDVLNSEEVKKYQNKSR